MLTPTENYDSVGGGQYEALNDSLQIFQNSDRSYH